MGYITSAMLVIVGIIHLLPLSGAMGAESLAALYGLDASEPNLAILLRHRAVLFGLLGALLLAAAFQPHLQVLGLLAGLISVLSFLWLAWQVGGYNEQLRRVFVVDIVALGCLVVGLATYALKQRPGL